MQATIRKSSQDSVTRPNMTSTRTRRLVLLFIVAALFLAGAAIYRVWPTVTIQSLPAAPAQAVVAAQPAQSTQVTQLSTAAQPAQTAQPAASQGSGRFGVALTTQQLIDQMQQRIKSNNKDYDAYA